MKDKYLDAAYHAQKSGLRSHIDISFIRYPTGPYEPTRPSILFPAIAPSHTNKSLSGEAARG